MPSVRFLFVVLMANLPGCMCVQVPDVRYACETSAECLSGERCLARRCAVATRDAGLDDDAGTEDAGTPDAGAADAGTPPDAGSTDAGVELCDNGLDDDLNGEADCRDPACRNVVCRPAMKPCDSEERCPNNLLIAACPPDLHQPDLAVCNDDDPCTSGTFCTSGNCGGGRVGEVINQCSPVDGGIHNLVRGACPTFACNFFIETPLFREVPDAGLKNQVIYSRTPDDGGVSCETCSDWHIATSAGPQECPINQVPFEVSSFAQSGLVPVFQYRTASGQPQSAYGLEVAPPAGYVRESTDPLFWACPP